MQIGANTLQSIGGKDIFLAKFDKFGQVLWSTSCGGKNHENLTQIITDDASNVYLTGFFIDSAFFSNIQLLGAGQQDIYLAKYDKLGVCQWAKGYGSTYADEGVALEITESQKLLMTGKMCSYNGSPPVYGSIHFDAINLISNGDMDIFVCSSDLDGNIIWAKNYGRKASENPTAIATDKFGNIYLTGYFDDYLTFDGNTILSRSNGFVGEVFIAKFDSLCNNIWAESIGGGNAGTPNAGMVGTVDIAVNNNDDIYLLGFYSNSYLILSDGSTLPHEDQPKDFYVKYDPNGNIIWRRKSGGAGITTGKDIWIDTNDNFYVTGEFWDDIEFDNMALHTKGSTDGYIVKGDKNGNYLYAINLGGISSDDGTGITGDKNGNIYSCGKFASPTFYYNNNTLTNTGNFDFYLIQLPSNISTSVIDIARTDQLFIAPNPNNGSFSVFIKQGNYQTLQLVDVMGKVVHEQNVSANKKDIITINAKLSSGMYFIKLSGKDGVVSKKMMVEY